MTTTLQCPVSATNRSPAASSAIPPGPSSVPAPTTVRTTVRRGGRGRREGGQGDRDARDERGERHEESAHRIIMPVADAAGTGGAP
jgi:hypothetical protein